MAKKSFLENENAVLFDFLCQQAIVIEIFRDEKERFYAGIDFSAQRDNSPAVFKPVSRKKTEIKATSISLSGLAKPLS